MNITENYFTKLNINLQIILICILPYALILSIFVKYGLNIKMIFFLKITIFFKDFSDFFEIAII